MSEFKYGDMVEVRDFVNSDWVGPVFYLGSIPLPNGGTKYFTMNYGEDELNFEGITPAWSYLRKVAPQMTIEERLERIETAIQKLLNQ